jgi:hypothetical protein
LDQLAREPRDLQLPDLEGSLRLLQRGALPLELTLRFLLHHALMLEGSSGLLEGGPLQLEPGFRLMARNLVLLELPLHRGQCGNPVRQVGPQLLGLLGLLLSLALPILLSGTALGVPLNNCEIPT